MTTFDIYEIGLLYSAVGHRKRQIKRDVHLLAALDALHDKLLEALKEGAKTHCSSLFPGLYPNQPQS